MKDKTKELFNGFVTNCLNDVKENINEAEVLDSKIFISRDDLNDIIFLIRLANDLNGSSIPKLVDNFDTKYGTINNIIHNKKEGQLRYRKQTIETLIADIELFFEHTLNLANDNQNEQFDNDANHVEENENLTENSNFQFH